MLVLPKGHYLPTKNPRWAVQTPNEAYRDDAKYRFVIDSFMRKHRVPGQPAWHEVRVVKQASRLAISSHWWDDPVFMEKVFWVYRSPITYRRANGEPAQASILEPYEAKRVADALFEMTGHPSFHPFEDCLVLPVDVWSMAWDETSAGYSDHIRWRPESVKTQEEIDRERKDEEVVKQIEERMFDIAEDKRFGSGQLSPKELAKIA